MRTTNPTIFAAVIAAFVLCTNTGSRLVLGYVNNFVGLETIHSNGRRRNHPVVTVNSYQQQPVLSPAITTTTSISSGLSSKKNDDDFSAFADSLAEEEDKAASPTTSARQAVQEPQQSKEKLQPQPQPQEDEDQSWQASLDEFVDPTTSIAQRQVILSKLLNANEDIRESVVTALRDRKIDPLLTPKGKKLQDGTRAVARQLASDILPTLTKSGSSVVSGGGGGSGVRGDGSGDTGSGSRIINNLLPQPTDVTKVGSRILNAISNQVQRNLENLQEDLSNPVERIPQRITAQTEGLVAEAKNVFSETPVGLQEPPYTVVSRTDDYEIRDYEEYTVATTTMGKVGEPIDSTNVAATGAAFNTLAAYIFGANEQRTAMEMTTPVTTTSWGEMRFYLASSSSSSPIPEPLLDTTKYETGSVEIRTIPAARLAVKRFTGFVTNGEISRQKDALLTAIQLDGIELDVPHGEPISHVIFQYNPPYTIPIVRRNEIAIPIRRLEETSAVASEWGTESSE